MSELANSLTDQKKQALLATWRPRNFDLMDYLVRALKAWRLLLGLTVFGMLCGLGYGLTVDQFYVSYANFMPPPAELNAATPVGSSLSLLSASMQGDTYLFLMSSRTLTDDVVKRTGLDKHLGMSPFLAGITMSKRASFDVQRNAVVTIYYRDPDPEWAAKVCNAYIDSLYRIQGKMLDSSYLHRFEFFHKQLDARRSTLEAAEDVLAANQEKQGTLSPELQVGAEQGQEVGLQNQIDSLDTQLAVLLASQTEQSPAVIGLRNQQAALRAQLARVKAGGLNAQRGMPGFNGAPQAIVRQNRRLRDVTEATSAYQSLLTRMQQTQNASADPGPELEVVDAALPPLYKEPSPVPKWLFRGAVLGLVVALFFLFAWPVLMGNVRKLRQRMREEDTPRGDTPADGNAAAA